MTKMNEIERFLQRVKTARSGGSREVRLTIDEAYGITLALAEATSRIATLEAELREARANTSVVVDGGSFR